MSQKGINVIYSSNEENEYSKMYIDFYKNRYNKQLYQIKLPKAYGKSISIVEEKDLVNILSSISQSSTIIYIAQP